MKSSRALIWAHAAVRDALSAGDLAVDATAGNGRDSVYLARRVGPPGRVFAFDVQREAITAARSLAVRSGVLDRLTFFQSGHERMAEAIPPDVHGKIRVVMFNLGFLPKGNKAVATRAETTVAALAQAEKLIGPDGVIAAVLHRGHAGGDEEADAVLEWATRLSHRRWECEHRQILNQKSALPSLIVARKLAEE